MVLSILMIAMVPSFAEWSGAKCFTDCTRYTCGKAQNYSNCAKNCKANQIPNCKKAYEEALKKQKDVASKQVPETKTKQTSASEESAVHMPLVTDLGGGKFTVNPKANDLRQDMVNMSKLAFLMRKKDPTVPKLVKLFEDGGWEITPFKGKTGLNNSMDDEPGFVAYRKKDNTMIVTLRGSDSSTQNPNTPKADHVIMEFYKKAASKVVKSADWEVNFDAGMVETPHGKMHRGFYNKAKAAHVSLMQIVARYIKKLSPKERESLQIFFTGHSQGAALAPVVAESVARELKSKELLGPTFDNTKSNTIQVYVFSAPRSHGDQKALDHLYAVIGKHNIIRQNVVGMTANDPVTVIVPGKTATALLKLMPIFGQQLADKYGGGGGALSVGYLAGDWAKDVFKRVEISESKGLADAIITNPVDVKNNVTRAITSAIAHLHYGGTEHGSPVEDGTGYTSVKAMEGAPPIEQLLEQGYKHKAKQDSGVGGAVRRGIEGVADVKEKVEKKIVKDAGKIKGALKNIGKPKNKSQQTTAD